MRSIAWWFALVGLALVAGSFLADETPVVSGPPAPRVIRMEPAAMPEERDPALEAVWRKVNEGSIPPPFEADR